nr:hypothetical protein [Acidobacteriota bacterium]
MTVGAWLRRWRAQDVGARVAKLEQRVQTLREALKAARRDGRLGDQIARRAEKSARTASSYRDKLTRASIAHHRLKRQMLSHAPLPGLLANRRRHFPSP